MHKLIWQHAIRFNNSLTIVQKCIFYEKMIVIQCLKFLKIETGFIAKMYKKKSTVACMAIQK